MTGEEFAQEHAKYLYGKGQPTKEEQPRTWLMAESGFYFLLEGDLDHELERLRKMDMPCTVHHNQTSISMSDKQAENERICESHPQQVISCSISSGKPTHPGTPKR